MCHSSVPARRAQGDVLRQSDGGVLGSLEPAAEAGLFEGFTRERVPYRFRIFWPDAVQETEDPYAFGLLLGEIDLHLINEGRHFELADCLGAQSLSIDGVNGVRFAVWAPNADPRRCCRRFQYMGPAEASHAPAPSRRDLGAVYSAHYAGHSLQIRYYWPGGVGMPWKADPVARQTELPPQTASIVPQPEHYRWHDQSWMQARGRAPSPRCADLHL